MPSFIDDVQDCGWYANRDTFGKTLRKYGWTKAEIRTAWMHLVEINHDEDNYENTDNLRMARKSNEQEVAEYREAAEKGCCGLYDEELVVEGTGETILFGFNYGH